MSNENTVSAKTELSRMRALVAHCAAHRVDARILMDMGGNSVWISIKADVDLVITHVGDETQVRWAAQIVDDRKRDNQQTAAGKFTRDGAIARLATTLRAL